MHLRFNMNQNEILVTVIIPTYNRAHLIQETIQSVLDQTFSTWELIVVDDGSNDNSENVVRKFADERIKFYRLEHSGKISQVRNAGLRHASGNYIAFLDSDDLWEPHKLEFQLSLLKKYPQAAFTFSHGRQFGNGAIPPPNLEMFFVGDVFHAQLMEERFVLYPSTFLFKKEEVRWYFQWRKAGKTPETRWKYFNGARINSLYREPTDVSQVSCRRTPDAWTICIRSFKATL
jgi:glycosyltransferase involved in cell wall biosynthesis